MVSFEESVISLRGDPHRDDVLIAALEILIREYKADLDRGETDPGERKLRLILDVLRDRPTIVPHFRRAFGTEVRARYLPIFG